MATETDPSGSGMTRQGRRQRPVQTHRRPTSPTPQADPGLQLSLNRVEERLNDVFNEIGDLRERAKASEEKLAFLPSIERRLRRLEYFAWVAIGVLITVGAAWAVLQFFLSAFDVTISPKT